jgi:DNA-binding protein YbaB
MEVMNVEILDEEILKNAPKLAKAMLEATNRAIKKAQQISAERMKDMMGGMPGMPGM